MSTLVTSPKDKGQKPRPYWHVDAKWVAGILFGLVVGAWLLMVAAYRITDRDVAVPVIKNGLQLYIDSIPTGDASQKTIDDFKRQIVESPTRSIELIPGSSVVFTEADLSLTPEQIKNKVFSPILDIAEPLYDKGARKLAEERTSDKEQQDKLANSLSAVGFINKQNHDLIGGWVWVFAVVVAGFGALVVFFSYRFGRIVAPALILLFVSLPGLAVFSMLAAPSRDAPAPTEAQDYFQLAVASKGVLLPAATAGQQVYLTVALVALALLVVALIGKIVYSTIKKSAKQT